VGCHIPANPTGKAVRMTIRKLISVNQIRSAIVKLSARAKLARSEGRPADSAEIEGRAQAYRDELGRRP
jgi:hypothetical protein